MDRVASLALDVLLLDAEIQPRETMSSSTIAEYAALYADGIELAPIIVYQEGSEYWVADGFHRVAAARQAGISELMAEVRLGGKRDALFHSCGANKHGKPLTNDDKRRVVRRFIADHEWSKWSDREIARHCGVNNATVSRMRKELSVALQQIGERTVQRGAQRYQMDASRIGSIRKEKPSNGLPIAPPISRMPSGDPRELGLLAASADKVLAAVRREEGLSAEDDISREVIEETYPPVIVKPVAPALRLLPDPPPVVDGKRSTFNKTNEMIDWAKWSWNPITGCLHNCVYCYARDIAERFYVEKFAPTFHPERLNAPHYTKVPPEAEEQVGYRNVFVCSMADLFGKWVPQEWIDAVMTEVRAAPQWNFLFLTKFPQRLETIDWPVNAWVGTSVDEQHRVKIAERAFRNVNASVKWLSCEPLRERLTFDSLEMFDWVVLGGQSKSTQAQAFQPPWEWVEHLWLQARAAQCLVYWKPNLLTRPQEYPGQLVPQGQ